MIGPLERIHIIKVSFVLAVLELCFEITGFQIDLFLLQIQARHVRHENVHHAYKIMCK